MEDYMLSELLAEKCEDQVTAKIEELIHYPSRYPDTFVWYFQKLMGQKKLPFPINKESYAFLNLF